MFWPVNEQLIVASVGLTDCWFSDLLVQCQLIFLALLYKQRAFGCLAHSCIRRNACYFLLFPVVMQKQIFGSCYKPKKVMGGYFFLSHLKVVKKPFHKIRNPTKVLITWHPSLLVSREGRNWIKLFSYCWRFFFLFSFHFFADFKFRKFLDYFLKVQRGNLQNIGWVFFHTVE